MKIIIAGSRHLFLPPKHIDKIVYNAEVAFGRKMTELVTGKARGIDTAGEQWRDTYRPKIGIKPFPYVDYVDLAVEKYGTSKMGGRLRNAAMADYAEGLILIWNGISSGSNSMYEEANKLNLPIFEVILKKKS